MPTTSHDSVRAKREKFREILARRTLTVMPGGFSPLYARMAEEIGFECFFFAGSQMSAFLLGVPDAGILSLRDIVDHARHGAARSGIPIMLDTDTGFGNAVNVHYAVQEVVRSGVSALSLEDQEAPKKSGTGGGRRCIPLDEAVGKIRAAVAARDEIDPAFVVCARCDSIGSETGGFEDALARCIAYAKDGGADFVWLNSIQRREHIEEACAAIPAPVLASYMGPAPAPTYEEMEAMGVRLAQHPTIAASAGLQGAWEAMNDLKERGKAALDDWAARSAASKWGAANFRRFVRLDDVSEIEERFLPNSSRRDYTSHRR